MTRFKRFPAAGAVLLAVLLIAGACGGGTSTTTTTTPPPATSSSGTGSTPASTTTTPPSACGSVPEPIPDQLSQVDNFISATLIPDWQGFRHDGAYTANLCWHEWDSDDCSAPIVGSTGLSYDFTHPCHRHDFGYRNYKRLEAETAVDTWNEVSKLSTDDQLLADAREHCSGRPWYLKNQCLAWAQVFYLAVRAFG